MTIEWDKAIVTIVTTFIGATMAFGFAMLKAQIDKRKEHVHYLFQILVQINWARNKIYALHTQAFDPTKNHALRHFATRAVLTLDEPASLSIELSNLPRKGDLINPALQAASAIEYARTAVRSLNEFSDYHRKEFQPELAKLQAKFKNGVIDARILDQEIPFQIRMTLQFLFENALSAADDAETQLKEAEQIFYKAAKSAFPKAKFPFGQFPDRSNATSTNQPDLKVAPAPNPQSTSA